VGVAGICVDVGAASAVGKVVGCGAGTSALHAISSTHDTQKTNTRRHMRSILPKSKPRTPQPDIRG
jgi:hypothetical protein